MPVHEVVSVLVQVSVDEAPLVIEVGLRERSAVGAVGVGGGFTETVTEHCDDAPLPVAGPLPCLLHETAVSVAPPQLLQLESQRQSDQSVALPLQTLPPGPPEEKFVAVS